MVGYMSAAKTYDNAKRFYYRPAIIDWIDAPNAVCLTCQNNKPKPKHRRKEPLEEWQNETVPLRTNHIDHKGPLHPPRKPNLPCLFIFDAFFLFLSGIHSYEQWSSSFYFCCREMDTFLCKSSGYSK